ncbi:hypothetical protein L6164_034797 [Bauhinia variegata]|uniref:Uncharacterized protein n=1 Tax=Bauhinia variegata TaxID=167791 RepID=A0ACB9KXA8_BAUVA|nr:hypothetical protein L6164_034797 [Bauhinia variegata]
MLCMLRSPRMNFEEFVFGYFRTQAHHILMKYKSHMGSDDRIKRLFFDEAFEANGTYCQHHNHKSSYDQALLEEEKEKKESSSFTSKKANTLKFLFFPASLGVSSFSL